MRRQLALYRDRILGRLVGYLIVLLRRAKKIFCTRIQGAVARNLFTSPDKTKRRIR